MIGLAQAPRDNSSGTAVGAGDRGVRVCQEPFLPIANSQSVMEDPYILTEKCTPDYLWNSDYGCLQEGNPTQGRSRKT